MIDCSAVLAACDLSRGVFLRSGKVLATPMDDLCPHGYLEVIDAAAFEKADRSRTRPPGPPRQAAGLFRLTRQACRAHWRFTWRCLEGRASRCGGGPCGTLFPRELSPDGGPAWSPGGGGVA